VRNGSLPPTCVVAFPDTVLTTVRWRSAIAPTGGDADDELPGGKSMHRSLWLRRVAAATALALVAAACGGDDDTTETETETEAPAEDDPLRRSPPRRSPPTTSEAAAEIERPERDDVLDIGYILPESGPLAFLGAPQITAVQLAIEDINAAGGVLGADVTMNSGDEAGDAAVARDTAARLINDGADAVVGAASSGMSQEFIQTLFDNEIVQCSGSNTSPAFTDQENNGFYFRTVPPDEAVAPIIANTVIGDGYAAPAVLARADDYGVALMELVEAGLVEQGVEPVLVETYDTETDDFDALVSQVTGAGADAAVVIGFDEAGSLFGALIEAGFPADALYGGDGVFGPALGDAVGTDISGPEGHRRRRWRRVQRPAQRGDARRRAGQRDLRRSGLRLRDRHRPRCRGGAVGRPGGLQRRDRGRHLRGHRVHLVRGVQATCSRTARTSTTPVPPVRWTSSGRTRPSVATPSVSSAPTASSRVRGRGPVTSAEPRTIR
jgi:ABC-type branched-subunit amino acid transport system substrate-binding protein